MNRRRPEVDVAQILARHGEMQARRSKFSALFSAWRWIDEGWDAERIGFESLSGADDEDSPQGPQTSRPRQPK